MVERKKCKLGITTDDVAHDLAQLLLLWPPLSGP